MDSEAEARMEFILGLRARGVTDTAVLEAMERTPRGAFLQGVFKPRAYEDVPLPIGSGQTISQPTVVGMMTQALELNKRCKVLADGAPRRIFGQPQVVAMMTQALELNKRCKVLEIGTGSGYQAAILSLLARRVYTTERHRSLAAQAQKVLAALDRSNVTVITADGTQGLPTQAPFDRILVTAAAEDPPTLLLSQLKEGGIMVLPVGQSDAVQTLLKVVKTEEGLDYTDLGDVRFVPLLEGVDD